ncbi:hypothetical protein ACSMFR_00615 [Listeria aquatica]|uniref:hypothetical protein n=1 Tax=Listeria aquatica TaxID=1494960 RepID=UPI003F729DAC
MKNKKRLVFTSILLILIILSLAVYRYHVVNQAYKSRHLVTEKVIPIKQEVQDKSVQFKVLNTSKKQSGDQINVNVLLSIKLLGLNDYGFKKNNKNFVENIWLNIPYFEPGIAADVYTEDGKRFVSKDLRLSKETKLAFHFNVAKQEVSHQDKPMRFSFLVPKPGRIFTKYSILIP